MRWMCRRRNDLEHSVHHDSLETEEKSEQPGSLESTMIDTSAALEAGPIADILIRSKPVRRSCTTMARPPPQVRTKPVTRSHVRVRYGTTSGTVPRIDIGLRDPFSLYSFVFDTSSALSVVVPGTDYTVPSTKQVAPIDTTAHIGMSHELESVSGMVTESVIIAPADSNCPIVLNSPIAVVSRKRDSIIGDGVMAASRKSAFVRKIGRFILIPPDRDQSSFSGGTLILGESKISKYCKSETASTVAEPLVPYVSGEWAFEGSVGVVGDASDSVTFLLHSAVQDIILPEYSFRRYKEELGRAGLRVSSFKGLIVIPFCDYQIQSVGIMNIPSLVINVGASGKMSVEIKATDLIYRETFAGTCTFKLRASPSEAVLGTPFLNSVTILFDDRYGRIVMCA